MAITSSYLLFINYEILSTSTENNITQEPIAKINHKENSVRRRSTNIPIWKNVKNKAPLYRNDHLFTDSNSEAEIVFSDGSKLNIGSSSLVVIDERNTEKRANLKRGNITASLTKTKSKLVLITGDTETQIESKDAKVQLQSAKDGSSKITVLKGQVVASKNGEKIAIKKNQRLIIDKAGVITELETLNIELIKPIADKKLYYKNDPEIQFKWQTSKNNSSVVIEVAKDHEFRNIIYSQKTVQTEISAKFPSLNGKLFWRVKSRKEKGDGWKLSSEQFIQIVMNTPPSLIEPLDKSHFSFSIEDNQNKSGRDISFYWDSLSKADSYNIEVARDIHFKDILTSQQTDLNSFYYPKIKEGQYYWHVKTIWQDNQSSSYSKAYSFNVTKNKAMKISKGTLPTAPKISLPLIIPEVPKITIFEAPILISPAHGYEVFYKNKFEPLILSWKDLPKSENYTIQITSDVNFKHIEIEKNIKENNFSILHPRNKKLFWRVQAYMGPLAISRWSKKRRVSFHYVKNIALELQKPLNKTLISQRHEKLIHFNWNKLDKVFSYKLEVSKDNDFKSIIHKKNTVFNFYEIKLSTETKYYWRVFADLTQDQGSRIPASLVQKTALSEIGSFNIVAKSNWALGLGYGLTQFKFQQTGTNSSSNIPTGLAQDNLSTVTAKAHWWPKKSWWGVAAKFENNFGDLNFTNSSDNSITPLTIQNQRMQLSAKMRYNKNQRLGYIGWLGFESLNRSYVVNEGTALKEKRLVENYLFLSGAIQYWWLDTKLRTTVGSDLHISMSPFANSIFTEYFAEGRHHWAQWWLALRVQQSTQSLQLNVSLDNATSESAYTEQQFFNIMIMSGYGF
ncbi:MAG: FecR domain-containing protein [Bdellovibrionaceae bacterium]|nr:FecR domain-containing protein [Pseudobdellovibrionaceae bacterium]